MIRDFREEDVPGIVTLLREVDSTAVVTAEVILHRHRTIPAKARTGKWVAERGGRVVGHARASLAWDSSHEGAGSLDVWVAPAARGHGLGAELYERALAHLRAAGARTAGSWAQPESVAFLERRGHEHRRSTQKSALDVRGADLSELGPLAEAKAREGFRVVPLTDVIDRPRDVFELDVVTSLDEPSDTPVDAMEYESWLPTTYAHPSLRSEGNQVVLAGERLVAWALIQTDGAGRAVNEFTGTHPDFRGRGLARLAKLAATAWAREAGVEVIYTGNDATNAPMLAINRRLGYRPVAEEHYLVRTL